MAEQEPENKPDKDQIEEEQAHLLSQWSGAHKNWKDTDGYIDLEFAVWDQRWQNKRSEYRPGRAPTIISHAVDVQMAFDPTISRIPVRDNTESQGWANSVEKALQGIQLDSFSQVMAIPPKELNRSQISYGYGIIEFEMEHSVMALKPTEPVREKNEEDEVFEARVTLFKASRRNWNPVRWRIPNPTEVLMNPMERNPTLAIKSFIMEAQVLHEITKRRDRLRSRTVEKVFSMFNKKRYEDVEVIERWTPQWHTLAEKTGPVLFTEKNTWGAMPFWHGFAGFGKRPGRDSKKNYAESMAVGLLDAVKDSITKQAQNYSAKHQVLMNHAYRQMGTSGDAAEVVEQMNEGQMLSEMEKDSIWIADAPEVSSQLFQAGLEIDADIEQATMSKALAGMRQAGVTTVGQEAILSTASQRFYAGVARVTEYMWSDAFGFVLRVVDVTGDEIGVNGKMLKPKEIESNYKIIASFEQIDLALKIQQQEIAMAEFGKRLLSRQSYWEVTGRADGTKERDQLLQDDIANMPEIWAIQAREQARKDGIEQEFNEALEIRNEESGINPVEPINPAPGNPNPGRTNGRNALTPQVTNPPRQNIGS